MRELEDTLQLNKNTVARPPCAGLHIRTRGELLWLMQKYEWSGEIESTEQTRANLQDIHLNGVYLGNINLNGADLRGARPGGTNFQGASLFSAKFRDADLRRVNVSETFLPNTDLAGADLESAKNDIMGLRDEPAAARPDMVKGRNMIRTHLIQRRIGASGTFRLRGEHVSRLEAFSDAVFAFAVTLLVVTLQPPQSYNDLLKVVHGLGAFALSFIMLIFVWFNHYRFFRRYGLEDQPTAVLNAILLFVVLFYVYPLRFLFTVVVAAFTAPDEINHLITFDQLPGLYVMYGAGVMAVFLLFALLNLHAYRQRAALELTPHETFETQSSMYVNLVVAAIGLISVISALAGFGLQSGVGGWIYVATAPAIFVLERIRRDQWTRHAARMNAVPSEQPVAPV